MRVMVTGAGGRIGSATVKALHEAGHEVIATDIAYRNDLPVQLHLIDLRDRMAVYPLLDGCEALVHLGNYSNQIYGTAQTVFNENVAMNMNAFQACADLGVQRIVFASSIQAISGTRTVGTHDTQPSCLPYLPVDSHLPVCPGNAYGMSKQVGEIQLQYMVRVHNTACTAFRFPFTSTRGRLERYLHMRPRTLEMLGDNHHVDECFLYLIMDDATTLIRKAMEKHTQGLRIYMPAAEENTLGWPTRQLVETFYPDVKLRCPVDQMSSLVDNSYITEQLDWTPGRIGICEEVAAG